MENQEWFDNKTPFNRRFALYLPTQGKDGNAVSGIEEISKATAAILCDLFGGVTSYPAVGHYRRRNGGNQQEPVVVQESFCEEQAWTCHSAFVHRLIGVLSGLLDQESIACSLDGNMVFVPPVKPGRMSSAPLDISYLADFVKSSLTNSDEAAGAARHSPQ